MPKAPRRQEPARKATQKGIENEAILLRRQIFEKAQGFEKRVAALFRLLGYQTVVDYKRDDQQFDVRLERRGVPPIYALVECKDTTDRVGQEEILKFVLKAQHARKVDKLPYQLIMIARSGFVNNAKAIADIEFVHLMTFQELLLSLVDLEPNLEAAIQSFGGTPLEYLYVEQDAVLEAEIRTREVLKPKGLTKMVLEWIERPNSTFLALLGDFGCGKSSFCKRLAWELATKSKEYPGEIRMPILFDLREGGSTTVTLENLLTHHFQRLSSQAFNPQALLHLNREGYLFLIFDGFDETIAYSEPGRYLENLRQILRAAEGKAKVLLTCRTHYFRDRPEALKRLGRTTEVISSPGATKLYEEIQERPGAEIGYVLEFRESQIEEYLKKALPLPADWRTFREQIRQTYNLEELAQRPFLLEIIVKTLPRLLERSAEVTLSDLYATYCESWFNHTDSRLTLTRDHKVTLVEHLACLIWNSPENKVHYSDLANRAAAFFQSHPLSIIEKERIDYEIRTALFLHRDAEGHYSFIHRSFLEFFVARTVREGLSKGDPTSLDLRRLTREVVFFIEFWPESKLIPKLAGRILKERYQLRVSENALLLLYFHARATLGPLVGSGSEVEALSEIRKIFSTLRPKSLHLSGANLEGASLPGIDLSEAHLEGARLTRTDLREACIDRAWLSTAMLSFADLRQGLAVATDFSGADLNHLDAQRASLEGANFEDADLSFARLTGARLSGAKLKQARIAGTGFLGASVPSGIVYPESAGPSQPRGLDLRLQVSHNSAINSVAWSPTGACLATGSDNGRIKLWDTSNGRLLNTLQGHKYGVLSIAWAPDGQRLASAADDSTVCLWDTATGRLLNTLLGHKHRVFSVAWAPDGQRLASASYDRTVRLWDTATGRLLNTLLGHKHPVFSVTWAPDGQRLASASYDQTVRLWDTTTGRLLSNLQGHENGILSVAWAPDGQRLASASNDKTIRLWDTVTGRLLNVLLEHKSVVLSVAWAPDGQRLASASDDHTVRLWDIATGQHLNSLRGHKHRVRSVAWAPDGRRLASASDDKTIRVWDATTGRLLDTLQEHETGVCSVAWAPDGQRLASASDDPAVRLWDAATGRLLNTLHGHEDGGRSVAWAPDGQRLASTSDDQAVRLWDTSTGRLLNTLQRHGPRVLSVAWAPDGQRLAAASDKTIRLWETATGRLLNTLRGHENGVRSVTWSPDGQRLASASDDHTVRIWNTENGRFLNILQGHEDWVNSVAWELGGERIASASDDKTVRVWDAASGRLVHTLQKHENKVHSVAWGPGGERIASASHDNTVRIWRPDSGEILQVFEISPLASSLSWSPSGQRLVLSFRLGFTEIWDLASNPPRPLVRLYHTPNGSGFAATPDGYVSGPPEALEYIRFGDGWALYDLTDVPERLSPERVAAALNPVRPPAPRRRGGTKEKS